jgi:hypothetical protein
MVHFPEFARTDLWIQSAVIRFCRIGFPHSEIPGSKPVCGSPRLIAAYHVLHRLLLPRHPPCALSSLTIKFTQRIRAPVARRRLCNFYGLISLTHRAAIAAPQSVSKALIKLTYFYITQPCRLPNLFSCQTSSAAEAASRLGGLSVTSAQNSTPTLSTFRFKQKFGGADRDRTGDPLVANQVLSQLSYSPTLINHGGPGKN